MGSSNTTIPDIRAFAPRQMPVVRRGGCNPQLANGYLAAVTPALELALASAHEAGHERAVRVLSSVIGILDDPRLR